MSYIKGTDQEQIAIFKRIVTMLQAGLHNLDQLAHKRDIAIGLGDYAEVLQASGREVGEKILDQLVNPQDLNDQIVDGIKSMRRVVVSSVRDIGTVKNAAMNGMVQTPWPSVEVQPTPPSEAPPEEDELGEELELSEEK
jgi:hypothetical protein